MASLAEARPLAGATALVTGGSRGIGRAVARALAAAGARVALVARGDAAPEDVADAVLFAVTRPPSVDVGNLIVERA